MGKGIEPSSEDSTSSMASGTLLSPGVHQVEEDRSCSYFVAFVLYNIHHNSSRKEDVVTLVLEVPIMDKGIGPQRCGDSQTTLLCLIPSAVSFVRSSKLLASSSSFPVLVFYFAILFLNEESFQWRV